MQERMDRVEGLLRRTDSARERMDRRLFLSDLLARLDELRGPGVFLNRFELTGRDLVLQGVAGDENQINAFQTQLIASRLFDDVALQYAQRKPQGAAEGVYFKIRCQKERL
jgi:Tfp pilus assembly protein PilN